MAVNPLMSEKSIVASTVLPPRASFCSRLREISSMTFFGM